MKRTNIFGKKRPQLLYKKNLLQMIKDHYGLLILACFLLAGIVLGALFARSTDISSLLKKLDFIFFSDFSTRSTAPVHLVFTASLASSFLFVLICFLLGLTMWGIGAIPFVLLFRGFGLGLTSGFLYMTYGIKGILFNLAVILPGAFICILSILLAAKEGISLSKKMAIVGFTPGKPVDLKLKLYFSRFGAIVILAVIASLIDTVTTVCFAGFFSF